MCRLSPTVVGVLLASTRELLKGTAIAGLLGSRLRRGPPSQKRATSARSRREAKRRQDRVPRHPCSLVSSCCAALTVGSQVQEDAEEQELRIANLYSRAAEGHRVRWIAAQQAAEGAAEPEEGHKRQKQKRGKEKARFPCSLVSRTAPSTYLYARYMCKHALLTRRLLCHVCSLAGCQKAQEGGGEGPRGPSWSLCERAQSQPALAVVRQVS